MPDLLDARHAVAAALVAVALACAQNLAENAWMRVGKKIINLDSGTGRPIVCAWDECDRPGLNLYTHVFCEHPPGEGCEHADRRLLVQAGRVAHIKFPFCSHRHMAYYVNAEGRNAHESLARTGRAYGNLPAGERAGSGMPGRSRGES